MNNFELGLVEEGLHGLLGALEALVPVLGRLLLGEDTLIQVRGEALHVPLHRVGAVLLLDRLVRQVLVLLKERVEGLVATDTRGNGFQLVVIPLLREDLLDLRA